MRSYVAQTSPPLPKAALAPLTPVLAETPPVDELDEEKQQQRDANMAASLAERVLRPARPNASVNTGYSDLVGAARTPPASSSPDVGVSSGSSSRTSSTSSPGRYQQTITRGVRSVRAELTPSLQFKLATELVHEEQDEYASAVQRKCDLCLAGDAPDKRANEDRRHTGASASATPATPNEIHAIARAGLEGASDPLPHLDRIQGLLAPHDLSDVRTVTGGAAAEANMRLGAHAYTVGNRIAFRSEPDVRLAAHEAAHVVQQRHGVDVPHGVGNRGDAYETAADAVAAAAEGGRNPILASYGNHVRQSTLEAATVQRQEVGDSASAPKQFVRQQVFSSLLEEWRNAGLLDPPFRPPGAAEFPPLGTRSGTLEVGAPGSGAAGAGAMGAASPARPLPEGALPEQPPLRVIPGGGAGPEPVPEPMPIPLPSALLSGIFVGLLVLLWPSSTAPPWLDELNPITRGPYGSPEEYEWVKRLSGPQLEYLRFLHEARQLLPDPAADGEGNPDRVPIPAPAPDNANPQQCYSSPVPRLGGHAGHNAYATRVTGSPYDYYVRTPVGLAINYDGLSSPRNVWEVKVGYGWFFNPATTALTAMVLARWDAQKNRGVAVAAICGYLHLWAHSSHHIVNLLNSRWGGIPPVLHIP